MQVCVDQWVVDILADPISKTKTTPDALDMTSGVVDARRYLPNTVGFREWKDGQGFYEQWQQRNADDYRQEIDGVRPVYDHIPIRGRTLDVGGGIGTLRHFLPDDAEYLSIDPFIDCWKYSTNEMQSAYPCLTKPLNFIAACAEFLPLEAGTFDWVHMRSMLDHVHSPDLALLEARRVLKESGKLVIGLYVDGGKSGRRPKLRAVKEALRPFLAAAGLKRYKDYHVFHPTFADLERIVRDNGFRIVDVYWQPQWHDQVCYLTAQKSNPPETIGLQTP